MPGRPTAAPSTRGRFRGKQRPPPARSTTRGPDCAGGPADPRRPAVSAWAAGGPSDTATRPGPAVSAIAAIPSVQRDWTERKPHLGPARSTSSLEVPAGLGPIRKELRLHYFRAHAEQELRHIAHFRARRRAD